MSELEFHLLDVFTDRPYGGNQLAVFPDAPELPAASMQAIARELNLSEIVFVRPATRVDALRRLRIFTPAMELPFAGHPTVGTAQLLVELGLAPQPAEGSVRFALQEEVGLVPVEVTHPKPGGYFTWLTTARLPERGPDAPPVNAIASILGLDAADVLADGVDAPRAYSAGVPYLYVPVRDRAALGRAQVDVARWREVLAGHWAPHLYAFAAVDARGATRPSATPTLAARMFAPAMGITEDPATGAGVAGLAGYLWERDRVLGRWVVRQGVEMGRPSELHIELLGDRAALRMVRVGGAAVSVGRGSLRAPPTIEETAGQTAPNERFA